MSREGIEEWMAGYITGDLTPEERLELEKLFSKDAALQQEALEMARLWGEMNAIEVEPPSAAMDQNFYAGLETMAQEPVPVKRVVSLPLSWIKAAVAVAACILAFVIGRQTAPQEPAIPVKIRVVRQTFAPASTAVQIAPATTLRSAKKATASALKPGRTSRSLVPVNAALAQQLRSVYASERIAAITELANTAHPSAGELKMLELALEEDPNPNVRLTIINALRPMVKDQDVQSLFINAMNKQSDVFIQSSIIDLLVEAKATKALPQMVKLFEEKNTNASIQSKIKEGIQNFLNE